jgi:hypothetical protein
MVPKCPVKIEAKGQDTTDLSGEEFIVWRDIVHGHKHDKQFDFFQKYLQNNF